MSFAKDWTVTFSKSPYCDKLGKEQSTVQNPEEERLWKKLK